MAEFAFAVIAFAAGILGMHIGSKLANTFVGGWVAGIFTLLFVVAIGGWFL